MPEPNTPLKCTTRNEAPRKSSPQKHATEQGTFATKHCEFYFKKPAPGPFGPRHRRLNNGRIKVEEKEWTPEAQKKINDFVKDLRAKQMHVRQKFAEFAAACGWI